MYKLSEKESKLVKRALKVLEREVMYKALCNPADVSDYLKLYFAGTEREIFTVLLLDNLHQVIHCEDLFKGTIDGASVYPREVVKLVLKHNAAAIIFAHNHPSGTPEPSEADKKITIKMKEALETIDVRVLDHIVIGWNNSTSFAERGYL